MNSVSELDPKVFAFLGDTHGNLSFINKAVQHAKNSGAQVVVQLGDAGVYSNFIESLTKIMEKHPEMTYLFIDGNHEDFTELYRHPVSEDGSRWFSDNVAHLPRGFKWYWSGKSFVAIGGGISVDRHHRVPYQSWDPRERLSLQESLKIIGNTSQDWPVDYVVAHDAPSEAWIPGLESGMFPAVAIADSDYYRESVLSELGRRLKPKNWVHGHYHVEYSDVFNWDENSEYTCHVRGLDCDGTPLSSSMEIVVLEE